jgi:hypothetical protein
LRAKDLSDIGDYDPFNYSIRKPWKSLCTVSSLVRCGSTAKILSYTVYSTTHAFTLFPASKVMGLQYSQARSVWCIVSARTSSGVMQLLVNKLGDYRASGTLRDPIIDPAQIRSWLPLWLHMFNQQFSLRLTLFHVSMPHDGSYLKQWRICIRDRDWEFSLSINTTNTCTLHVTTLECSKVPKVHIWKLHLAIKADECDMSNNTCDLAEQPSIECQKSGVVHPDRLKCGRSQSQLGLWLRRANTV